MAKFSEIIDSEKPVLVDFFAEIVIHRIFFSLLIVSTLLSCANSGQAQSSGGDLSAEEFSAKMKSLPSAPLIDVRTAGEFSKGHLPQALNYDWNGNNFQEQISGMDKSKPVFVYCLSGGRSAAAASFMRSKGFTEVYELKGGIMSWRSSGLPETNSSSDMGMSKSEFEKLTDSPKLVLVDFYADWCAPCKKMEPYLKEIARDMADKVEVVRINADENRRLCKEFNVEGLPVLQLYKNKSLIWEHKGYIGKEDVVDQLKR